jgi:uncharacterized Fe-S cluster-containing radical SAM superfamily protein
MDYPVGVHIETTGRCNSQCSFCPHHMSPRRHMDMSPGLFAKIVKDLKDIPTEFVMVPFKLGEPLLDPLFSQRLLKINDELPRAHFEIHTNLNYLPRDFIPTLRKLRNVRHVWVSLNQYDAEAYKSSTQMSFKKTCSNIHRLLDSGLKHEIIVGRVATYDVEDQKWTTWAERVFPTAHAKVLIRGDWCNHVKFPTHANPPGSCKRTREISICCDGKVALCCMDGLCEYPLGDVNYQHVLEVFNCPAAITMRNMTHRLWKPCSTCTFI